MKKDISFTLPDWLLAWQKRHPIAPADDIGTMALAIELAQSNIDHGTGGPFGALIIDETSRDIITPGINLVTSANCSILHAEMVAITLAQQRLNTFDLGTLQPRLFTLYTSVEPCAMCFGAIPWSGLTRIVSGANDADARAIGFDEGPKVKDWVACLSARNISVTTSVSRPLSAQVLNSYAMKGGTIYNGQHTNS